MVHCTHLISRSGNKGDWIYKHQGNACVCVCVCVTDRQTDRQRPLHFRNSFRVPEITCLVKFGQADQSKMLPSFICKGLSIRFSVCFIIYAISICPSDCLQFFFTCVCVCVLVVFLAFLDVIYDLECSKKMFTKSFFTQNFTCIFFHWDVGEARRDAMLPRIPVSFFTIIFFLRSCKHHCDSLDSLSTKR